MFTEYPHNTIDLPGLPCLTWGTGHIWSTRWSTWPSSLSRDGRPAPWPECHLALPGRLDRWQSRIERILKPVSSQTLAELRHIFTVAAPASSMSLTGPTMSPDSSYRLRQQTFLIGSQWLGKMFVALDHLCHKTR